MPYFGERSQKNLETCHPDLQLILKEAIKIYDFSVIEGHRSVERQYELYLEGKSHIDGKTVLGKHNCSPSKAVDIIPYKKGVDPFKQTPKNAARFYYMMGIMYAISKRLHELGKITHRLRFGLDWNSNDIFTDQTFHDLPHMELVKI